MSRLPLTVQLPTIPAFAQLCAGFVIAAFLWMACHIYTTGNGITSDLWAIYSARSVPVPTGLRGRWENKGAIRLEWKQIPGVNSYVIEMASGTDEFRSVARTVDDWAMHEIWGLRSTTTYRFRVRTCTGSRLSDPSGEVTLAPNPPGTNEELK